jgi:hypothetical protein
VRGSVLQLVEGVERDSRGVHAVFGTSC